MRLVKRADLVESTKQVRNIENFYGALVKKSAELLRHDKDKTLRDIDREYFIKMLEYPL